MHAPRSTRRRSQRRDDNERRTITRDEIRRRTLHAKHDDVLTDNDALYAEYEHGLKDIRWKQTICLYALPSRPNSVTSCETQSFTYSASTSVATAVINKHNAADLQRVTARAA